MNNNINYDISKETFPTSVRDEALIRSYLKDDLKISPNLVGYPYLISAINMVIKAKREPVYKRLRLTREVYPEIAKKYCSTAIRVERGIRHAIGEGIKKAGNDTIAMIFPYAFSAERPSNPRLTNSEFIYGLADYLEDGGD